MSKIAPANPECEGCFYVREDRMKAPCVYCSRAFDRKDMYLNEQLQIGENNNGENTNYNSKSDGT